MGGWKAYACGGQRLEPFVEGKVNHVAVYGCDAYGSQSFLLTFGVEYYESPNAEVGWDIDTVILEAREGISMQFALLGGVHVIKNCNGDIER